MKHISNSKINYIFDYQLQKEEEKLALQEEEFYAEKSAKIREFYASRPSSTVRLLFWKKVIRFNLKFCVFNNVSYIDFNLEYNFQLVTAIIFSLITRSLQRCTSW